MIAFPPRRLRPALLLTVLMLVTAATATAAPNRRRITSLQRELSRLLRAEDYTGARRVIGELRSLTPDDPRLDYNLACVASRLGDAAQAAAALDAAFRRGFDDLRRAEQDPDLAAVRDDSLVAGLLQRWRRRLAARAAAGALTLRMGETSAPLPLHWEPGGGEAPVTVTVRVDTAGFHLLADLPASAWQDRPQAWVQGGGLLVTVALPDSGDLFDTTRAWRFGLGQRDGEPVGVLLQQPDRWVNQRVLELAPRIRWDPAGGRRRVSVDLPWSVFVPYAPPVDSLWGLNVRHCGRDDAGGLRVDSLLPDPAAALSAVTPARFAPVRLRPGRGVLYHGRVDRAVVGERPLRLDLVAWADTTLPVRLETTVTDNHGRSVVHSGATTSAETLRAGTTHWHRLADLSALPDGPYRLVTRLVLPDSSTLDWRTGLFRFRREWLAGATEKSRAVAPWARPSLEYRLSLVTAELDRHLPRTDPAPLLATVAEVNRLLARWDDAGTLLEPGRSFIAAYTTDDGRWLTCPLDVPPDWTPGRPAPVLVLVGDAALASQLHDRLTGASGRRAVLAAPALRRGPDGRPDPQDLITALGWLREALGGPVWLAPLGGEGAALLADVRDHTGLVDDTWEPAAADPAAMARDLRRWLASRADHH